MTIGDGIFWSTVLVLAAAAIWQFSARGLWKKFARVVLGGIGLGIIIGGAFWAWGEYQNRPVVMAELAGVRLGMSPVEVTLNLGSPSDKLEEAAEDGKQATLAFVYFDHRRDPERFVRFYREGSEFVAAVICSWRPHDKALGFGVYSFDEAVRNKLGEPTSVSISNDGLSQIIAYSPWKVAFGLEKGRVKNVCISESGEVRYTNEHQSSGGRDTPSATKIPAECASEATAAECAAILEKAGKNPFDAFDDFGVAPPCASDAPNCKPWEREWGAVTVPEGAYVTDDGRIVKPVS